MAKAIVLDHSHPTAPRVDNRLLVGALMFGAGWGLAGICPGPAIVSITAVTTVAARSTAVFIPSMIVGMVMEDAWEKWQGGRGSSDACL